VYLYSKFRLITTIRIDYLLKQHLPVGLCNCEAFVSQIDTVLLNIILTNRILGLRVFKQITLQVQVRHNLIYSFFTTVLLWI
jgi:hypothetical protein